MKKLLSMMLVMSLYFCFNLSASQDSTKRLGFTDFVDNHCMSEVKLEINGSYKKKLTVNDICGAACFVVILAAPHVIYAYLQNNRSV